MMRWRIALRNLMRNRRRTLLNIVMIVSGFCAIVLFRGFAANILVSLQRAAIDVQHGHFQVGAKVSWDMTPVEKSSDRLISGVEALEAKLSAAIPNRYISGRLNFYGLISTGEQSVSAMGVGYDPIKERMMSDGIIVVEGRKFQSASAFEVMVGEGLVKQLQAKVGSQLTLIAQTVDGSVNAMDVEFVGIARTGVGEIDNVTFYLPVKLAQRLLDTEGVERLVVMLPQTAGYEAAAQQAKTLLPKELDVRTWFELATLYRQTEDYFRVQNTVIEWIILVLVLLSISNTVGNSVVERTGEIGTVRALGDKRRDIVLQFLIEGCLLSLVSGVVAVACGILLAHGLSSSGILLPIPGATKQIPLKIEILPMAFVKAFLLTSFTAVLATLIPAFRASRLAIVDALKRNI